MVTRGIIYMSAGSSLFSWEPVSLPKICISSHPLNWSAVVGDNVHALSQCLWLCVFFGILISDCIAKSN